MDPRLLRLYNDELTHLREVGAEFAQEFPKIAVAPGHARAWRCADPYVERLLEGFAFLAARVQLKLDAEHPRLIAHLLETIYPNFLSPVPSMMVARLRSDPIDPNLLKRLRRCRAAARWPPSSPRGQDTRCEFRTAHDVTLWPIELAGVQYFTHAPDLPLTRLPAARRPRGGLRIRLRCGGGAAVRPARASTGWRSTSRRRTTWHSACTSWCSATALGSWVGRAGSTRTAPAGAARPACRPVGLRRRRSAAAGDAARLLAATDCCRNWRPCRSASCSSRSATSLAAWPACTATRPSW